MKTRKAEYLQRLVNSALPMLRQKPRLGVDIAEIEHVVYLGVADSQGRKYLDLADEISKLLQGRKQQGFKVKELKVLETGNPSEIYLYMSDFAFPLPLLQIVEQEAYPAYSDFYEKLHHTGAGNPQQLIPLHLSKAWEGKFEDLVVYTDEQANTLREIISIILFGHMLKVLVLKEEKGLEFYYHMLGQPFSRLDPIGPRRQVITNLLHDSKLRKTLTSAVKDRENTLTGDQLLAYHRAVVAAESNPELIRNTPDSVLLGQKMVELGGKGDAAVKQDLDEITKIDHTLRYGYLRKLEHSGIEWVLDSHPTVQSLPVWELRTENA